MDDKNNYNFFFWLNTIANLLQVENYNLLLKDKTNNELMTELQKQDKILQHQNNDYLEKILKQNEEIIRLLKDKK